MPIIQQICKLVMNMAEKIKILWVDDEIELLKPHILFLKDKGYDLTTTCSGNDALDFIKTHSFDIIFLDEQMPGLSGLETLDEIKKIDPSLPVVMITKSEEETIMNDAIGAKISDYLIKPVNPNQILLSIKKNLENRRLISEKTTSAYQQEFRELGIQINDNPDFAGWADIYSKLVYWELELEQSGETGMEEILSMQKSDANNLFAKHVQKHYKDWISGKAEAHPVLSHTLFKDRIHPFLQQNEDKTVFLIIVDNLRFDQWKVLQPIFERYYRVQKEELYYSILPTCTQYARNAFFAGLMPSEIEKKYPKLWVNENEDLPKNKYESELFAEQLKRLGYQANYSYNKILNLNAGKKLSENLNNYMNRRINVIVYNFVDMLSHARTEMEVIKELADDEPAYRSLTFSWFEHSPLHSIIRTLAEKNIPIVLTTDHGSIRVQDPVKVIGDKNTSTNLRYKQGRNLDYKEKEVFSVKNPTNIFLPKTNVSTSYIFAREDSFLAYPNNYNYYVNYYKNTFQHGGISMEEMLIPLINLKPR